MASISELVTQLGSEDQLQVYHAHRDLAAQVNRATDPNQPSQRAAVATALAAELAATTDDTEVQHTNVPGSDLQMPRPKHPPQVRRLLCQLLCQIAADEQLPALVAAGQDLKVRENVRWVYECIGTPLANRELIKSLAQVGPDFRIGVLNSLGRQRSREAGVTLARLALDPDSEVRLAAIEGLAHFSEAANDSLIADATRNGSPRDQARAQQARVQLADTLRWAGEKRDAIAIYRAILADAPKGPWHTAARRGLEQLKAQAV